MCRSPHGCFSSLWGPCLSQHVFFYHLWLGSGWLVRSTVPEGGTSCAPFSICVRTLAISFPVSPLSCNTLPNSASNQHTLFRLLSSPSPRATAVLGKWSTPQVTTGDRDARYLTPRMTGAPIFPAFGIGFLNSSLPDHEAPTPTASHLLWICYSSVLLLGSASVLVKMRLTLMGQQPGSRFQELAKRRFISCSCFLSMLGRLGV